MPFSANHRSLFSLLLWLLLAMTAQAQTIQVVDKDTGTPVVDAAVYTTTNDHSAISDANGVIDLSDFPDNSEIHISHISYTEYIEDKKRLLKGDRIVMLEPRSEALHEVVMSVSRWEQKQRNVPQKVVAISEEVAQFSNPQTTADLLALNSQVFVQKSQMGGGSPMIRGFSTNRVLLTVDGVRMNNAIFRGGNVHNVISLDPFALKSTEIIFGPASIAYGSDAIGGVMNFYTQKPKLSTEEKPVWSNRLATRFSSANLERTLNLKTNYGDKKWGALLNVTYNHFDDLLMGAHGPEDYLRPNYVITDAAGDRLKDNDNDRLQRFTGYSQWNILNKYTYKPSVYFEQDLGIHYSATNDIPRYDRLIRPDSETGLRSASGTMGRKNG